MPLFNSPFADLDLIRQPEQANDPLLAFDAADQYLLEHLAAQAPAAGSRVLVLNDSFGALAASLATGRYQQRRLAPGAHGVGEEPGAMASRSMPCLSYPPVITGKGHSIVCWCVCRKPWPCSKSN
jgi:hypothetical protein